MEQRAQIFSQYTWNCNTHETHWAWLNNSGLQIADCIINPELEFQTINYIILVSRCRMQLCTGGKLTTRAFTLYSLQYWFVNCNVIGAAWAVVANTYESSMNRANQQSVRTEKYSGRITFTISSLFYSREYYVTCDCFCVTPLQFQNQLIDFHEIWSECYAITYHIIRLLYIS